MIYYLDTSAAAKLYVDEAGSAWLRDQIANAVGVVSSCLLIIELTSAVQRRLREGFLSLDDSQRILTAFHADCRVSYQLAPLTPAIIERACALLAKHPMRSYDATHLATALVVEEILQRGDLMHLTFASADERLNAAAVAEGLAVVNPTQFP